MKTFLDIFERRFSGLNERSCLLLRLVGTNDLYRKPRVLPKTFTMFSVGEYILRSAATVEQTFGALTTRMWDDPFEWTLPEQTKYAGPGFGVFKRGRANARQRLCVLCR